MTSSVLGWQLRSPFSFEPFSTFRNTFLLLFEPGNLRLQSRCLKKRTCSCPCSLPPLFLSPQKSPSLISRRVLNLSILMLYLSSCIFQVSLCAEVISVSSYTHVLSNTVASSSWTSGLCCVCDPCTPRLFPSVPEAPCIFPLHSLTLAASQVPQISLHVTGRQLRTRQL